MEREPEENGDAEHGEEGIHALLDFLGHGEFFLGGVVDGLDGFFFGRVGKAVLEADEDYQRDEHCHDRGDERVVDAGVEHVEILGAECADVGRRVTAHLGDEGIEVVGVLHVHVVADREVFVGEGGEIGVVGEAVDAEPPRAQHGSYEGRDEAADVDEHIENLESRVTLGCVAGIVVELTHDGLEVALEQAVAEGDEEEREAGEGQQPRHVVGGREDGHGEDAVAQRHNDETLDDGPLVVLGFVGDVAADEAQDVDTGIEARIDDAAGFVAETELGAKEEHEHGVHDVVAESFAHVAQRGGNKTLWLVFKHRIIVYGG